MISKSIAQKASHDVLMNFSRKVLRSHARTLGVKRGRNKENVVKNLVEAGATVRIWIQLEKGE